MVKDGKEQTFFSVDYHFVAIITNLIVQQQQQQIERNEGKIDRNERNIEGLAQQFSQFQLDQKKLEEENKGLSQATDFFTLALNYDLG